MGGEYSWRGLKSNSDLGGFESVSNMRSGVGEAVEIGRRH
jgi:hypothetical protein